MTLRLSPPTHPTQLVLCQTLHSKHETTHTTNSSSTPSVLHQSLLCCQHTHMFPTPCALSHTILRHTTTYYLWGVFVSVILVSVISQHLAMLPTPTYQPPHLQGTSTETSSHNRLPA